MKNISKSYSSLNNLKFYENFLRFTGILRIFRKFFKWKICDW